jgi:hypothetical protein
LEISDDELAKAHLVEMMLAIPEAGTKGLSTLHGFHPFNAARARREGEGAIWGRAMAWQ